MDVAKGERQTLKKQLIFVLGQGIFLRACAQNFFVASV